jgi:hypothetical protein
MQLQQAVSLQIAFQLLTLYLGIGFFVWYFFYGLEVYLNGGLTGKGRGRVFKCFWEDVSWFSPGGLSRRTDYIRKMVNSQQNSAGSINGYRYEQIREQNLYELVAKQSLGNGFYFWGICVILPFFLWPLLFLGIVVLTVRNRL